MGQSEHEIHERLRRQQISALRISKGMEPVKSGKVNVGLIGSGFITAIHTDALKRCGDAQIVAVASPSKDNAKNFARKHGIPNSFKDYRKMLEMDELDLVVLGIPNDLHCQVAIDAAAAGKH